MRHQCRGRVFGRNSAQRKLMFSNLINSLVQHEKICTTVAKGKELRRFFEPLVTRAKKDTLANRRLVFNYLRDTNSVHKLFTDIAIRCMDRPGGYLRLLRYGFRKNDNAPLAIIQLVDPAPVREKTVKKIKTKITNITQPILESESTATTPTIPG